MSTIVGAYSDHARQLRRRLAIQPGSPFVPPVSKSRDQRAIESATGWLVQGAVGGCAPVERNIGGGAASLACGADGRLERARQAAGGDLGVEKRVAAVGPRRAAGLVCVAVLQRREQAMPRQRSSGGPAAASHSRAAAPSPRGKPLAGLRSVQGCVRQRYATKRRAWPAPLGSEAKGLSSMHAQLCAGSGRPPAEPVEHVAGVSSQGKEPSQPLGPCRLRARPRGKPSIARSAARTSETGRKVSFRCGSGDAMQSRSGAPPQRRRPPASPGMQHGAPGRTRGLKRHSSTCRCPWARRRWGHQARRSSSLAWSLLPRCPWRTSRSPPRTPCRSHPRRTRWALQRRSAQPAQQRARAEQLRELRTPCGESRQQQARQDAPSWQLESVS